MAEGKKGFLLYADYEELFNELSDEDAGQLIKHIFDYVNDRNPETENKLVKISFIPIKRQLKRDLQKYEQTKVGRSKAGKASAEARRIKKEQQQSEEKGVQQNSTNSTNVKNVQQSSTNSTDNVNDNVNVNESEIKERENTHPALLGFKKNVQAEAQEQGIPAEVAKAFFEYWTQIDYNSKLFLFQAQKGFAIPSRLKNWYKIEQKNTQEVKTKEPNYRAL